MAREKRECLISNKSRKHSKLCFLFNEIKWTILIMNTILNMMKLLQNQWHQNARRSSILSRKSFVDLCFLDLENETFSQHYYINTLRHATLPVSTLAKGLFKKNYKAPPWVTKNRKDSKVFSGVGHKRTKKLGPCNFVNTLSQSRTKRIYIYFKVGINEMYLLFIQNISLFLIG